jgi:hypothetical protein
VNAERTNRFGQELDVLHVSCQSITIMTANSASNVRLDNTLKDRFVNVYRVSDRSFIDLFDDLHIFYLQIY